MNVLQDKSLEDGILASVIIIPSLVDTMLERLTEDDFYFSNNKMVFKSIHDMMQKKGGFDFLTLCSDYPLVTDVAVELANVGTSTKIDLACDKLISITTARNVQMAAAKVLDMVDVPLIPKEAERLVFEASQRAGNTSLTHIRNFINPTFEEIQRLNAGIEGVKTGIPTVDQSINGLMPGELCIVAGRPGSGKTSFALSILENMAQAKKICAIFELEMSGTNLVKKIMSRISKKTDRTVTMTEFRHNVSKSALSSLGVISSDIANLPIYIDDNPCNSFVEIMSKCRKLKSDVGLDCVFLDYLGLVETSREQSREREVAVLTRNMKMLSKMLKVPVVLLSQLNRSNELRKEKRPILSDLRESGAVEQDADFVMFMHYPHNFDKSEKENVFELIIAKGRNTGSFAHKIVFDEQTTTFYDYDAGGF